MTQPNPSFRRAPVMLLGSARAQEDGIHYQPEDSAASRPVTIAWSQVERVLCADVGEPEGVRTIVFDVLVEVGGADPVVYRLGAEPGQEAMDVARSAERSIPRRASTPALRDVAKDGGTHRWFPDIESFEEANLATLESDSVPL